MRKAPLLGGTAALAAVAGVAFAQPMLKITPVGSLPSAPGPAANFTGTVRVDPLFQPIAPARTSGAHVTFEPGARTNWHTHPAGQTLVVTAGSGFVQQEGQPAIAIRPGDVVQIPANVRHWHGAAPTTAMTHLALTEAIEGKVVDWAEPVTEEQYKGTGR